jgi:hypothetical protein
MNAFRLFESHWICLREGFLRWLEEEPFIDADRPTQVELDEYYEDQRQHEIQASDKRSSHSEKLVWSQPLTVKLQRGSLLSLASRLASSLGIGRLNNAAYEEHLERMMLHCFKFAFSTEGQDEEAIGKRLGILSFVSKYVSRAVAVPCKSC